MTQLKLSKRYHTIGKPIKNAKPAPELYQIYKEFDDYQRENYSTIPVDCLCGHDNSYLISKVDREGWEYQLMICQSCGLIRTREYWDEKSVIDYYKNWYRKKYGGESNPSILFDKHKMRSKKVWNFVIDYSKKLKEPYTVVDIGGGSGGKMALFKNNNCYLFDFNKSLLKNAEKMGISTIEGGIDKLSLINDKPDLVILSHVIEHFTNVDKELKTLKANLKIGSLVYIEVPGIDSLKNGRRGYDFLGDLHWPHVYYFSVDVLNNLMLRYGFRCLKSNTEIMALYEYTGESGGLINYHDSVCDLIRTAERKRQFGMAYIKQLKYLLTGVLQSVLNDRIKKYLKLLLNQKQRWLLI